MQTVNLSTESLRDVALEQGVCIRPVVQELHDTVTGHRRLVPIACGSTQERKCPPCAERNRKLRAQQCREGWHLEEEPDADDPEPADDADDEPDSDDDNSDDDTGGTRRVRSTRRRQDAPDLPRLPVENRTIGRTFRAPDGKTWRPSMFATFTLPSYGRVNSDGTPSRSQQVQLPPCRAGRDALPQAAGPLLAEPASRGRLPGAVLRGRRASASPGSPSARRDPWRDSARAGPAGSRRDLPPVVVAALRRGHLPRPSACLNGLRASGTSTPTWASRCPPGTKRSTTLMPTQPPSRGTWCGSASSWTCRESWPAAVMPTAVWVT